MPENPKSVTYTINISNKLKNSSDDELKMMAQLGDVDGFVFSRWAS
jgi:hypothetical protein